MTAWMLSNFGNDEIKKKKKKMVSMEFMASYCLTEAGSGSDAAGMKTRALYHKDNKSYE